MSTVIAIIRFAEGAFAPTRRIATMTPVGNVFCAAGIAWPALRPLVAPFDEWPRVQPLRPFLGEQSPQTSAPATSCHELYDRSAPPLVVSSARPSMYPMLKLGLMHFQASGRYVRTFAATACRRRADTGPRQPRLPAPDLRGTY